MKSITLIFYGSNSDAAKELAVRVRADRGTAQIRHAAAYGGETEPCDRVTLLPCVSEYDRGRIAATYGDKIAQIAPPPPPPPPGAPDPLANLPEDWKNEHGARLKSIAFAVSGRTVENKDQAIQVIEQALVARG
jgi:hypothetical protein